MTALPVVVVLGVVIAAVAPASAQGMHDSMAPSMMRDGKNMNQCMMMHGMDSGMMSDQRDHSTMMGSRMMGPAMMQGGTKSGMSALFGSRVAPIMNLSVEDARGYLSLQLEQLNNRRLKIGDLKTDEGTITADIVTVDNSLVQRLKINRHTGAIEYEP